MHGRAWRLADGQQLACLQGHRGRGIWRCSFHTPAGLLLTAGADASIKLWRMADWLPQPASSSCTTGPHQLGQARHALQPQKHPGQGLALRMHSIPCQHLAAVADAARPLMLRQERTPEQPSAQEADVVLSPSGTASEDSGGAAHSGSAVAEASAVPSQLSASDAGGTGSNAVPITPGQQLQGLPAPGSRQHPPKAHGSQAEWVRAVAFTGLAHILVATNRGLLHRVTLPTLEGQAERWELLHVCHQASPITCMAVSPLSRQQQQTAHQQGGPAALPGVLAAAEGAHLVALGQNSGTLTYLAVAAAQQASSGGLSNPASSDTMQQIPPDSCGAGQSGRQNPGLPGPPSLGGAGHVAEGGLNRAAVQVCCCWQACSDGAVLGAFWPAVSPRHLFATSSQHQLQCWLLPPDAEGSQQPHGGEAACCCRGGLLRCSLWSKVACCCSNAGPASICGREESECCTHAPFVLFFFCPPIFFTRMGVGAALTLPVA